MKSIALTTAIAALALLAGCGGTAADDASETAKGSAAKGKDMTREEVAAAARDVKITPGEWENSVTILDVKLDESKLPPEARGMVGPMLQSMVGKVNGTKSCITPEEAAKPDASFMSGNEDANCSYQRFDMSGGKMDIAMTCEPEKGQRGGAAEITMTGTYSPTSYDMTMDMTADAGEIGPMTIKANSKGKRIGECPSGAADE